MRRLVVLLALIPAAPAAAARAPQPLVDVPPQGTVFLDRVGPSTRGAPRAVKDSPPAAYRAPDGQTVSVVFSGSYEPDAETAQSYVDFLGGLPHGKELSKLQVYIATPDEVRDDCGGIEGTLACYDPSDDTMTVPGEQTADDGSGVTTNYVVAHEYGHHIANHRANAPFLTLNWGPKYWGSQERVCLRTIQGRLAPGDEGENYLANPGEAWADTYAHLTYPRVHWQFTPLLRPSQASKAAALKDVLTPWTGYVTQTFPGRFSPGGAHVQAFHVALHLDGSLRIALHGPAAANFDISVSSLGTDHGSTKGPHSSDVYFTRFACREVDSEDVMVKVVRRHGFGAFTAEVTYAG
jgi:hypothetical protein